MPFSHHSHSGQFCSHATNTLEEMIQTAISKKMSVFCLTEHMPREAQDLYPGEIEDTLKTLNITGEYRVSEVRSQTVDLLIKLFDDYYNEAVRLREKYADRINILVGMEVDWIRPSSKEWIQGLLDKYKFDLFIGSVHHVHGTPIDYDRRMYEDARNKSEGTDENLFEDYFDLQFELLKAMKPPVIGHFDLICLKSDVPDASMKETYSGHNSMVWKKISRNLDYVMDYGGIVEINSAALRKGLAEPYPKADICKAIIARGIPVTLSDDAHGVAQIGTNYANALAFAKDVGFRSFACLGEGTLSNDARFPDTKTMQIKLSELLKHSFFSFT